MVYVGRSTLCTKLAEKHRYIHISSGDLVRAEAATGSELGKEWLELMKQGKLVPTKSILLFLQAEMDRRLDHSSDAIGFLFDGFPGTRDQAMVFEREVKVC